MEIKRRTSEHRPADTAVLIQSWKPFLSIMNIKLRLIYEVGHNSWYKLDQDDSMAQKKTKIKNDKSKHCELCFRKKCIWESIEYVYTKFRKIKSYVNKPGFVLKLKVSTVKSNLSFSKMFLHHVTDEKVKILSWNRYKLLYT